LLLDIVLELGPRADGVNHSVLCPDDQAAFVAKIVEFLSMLVV